MPPTFTVLVVEDDHLIRRLLGAVLRDNGYEVIAARDGREALECARSTGIDLLLTDILMPELGGLELADRLTALNPGLNVIFMSGYSEELLSLRLEGSTRTLLEKPFPLPELLERVRTSLETRQ